jgi:hypothetical protein
MAKDNLPLLFVDTNVFLSFYKADGEAGLTLLEHVQKLSGSLIVTDQIEGEFLNNRQRVISDALERIVDPKIPLDVPAYLKQSATLKRIQNHKSKIKDGIAKLRERIEGLTQKPERDPVFKTVRKVFAQVTPINLKFAKDKQDLIFDSALRRFQRGYPPRKKQDNSIGDAINWEWILDCAKTLSRDVLIVARDGDYGLYQKGILNDFLSQQFKAKTKRKAELVQLLSDALSRLNVKVSEAEVKEEQQIVQKENPQPNHPAFWPKVLDRVFEDSPAAYGMLKMASSVDYVRDNLRVTYLPHQGDMPIMILQLGVGRMIQEAFKELDFAPLKSFSVGTLGNEHITAGFPEH